jgi:hypothetical protein
LTLSALERGIFFVRADGTHLRRLGDASQAPTTREIAVFTSGPGVIVESGFALSPGQSTIAFSDVGPGADGVPARQIFTMDLSSGDRLQVTRLTAEQFPGAPSFIDDRTIVVNVLDTALDPSDPNATQQSFSVRADGRGELHPLVGSLVPIEGAQVVPIFDVTRGRMYAALVTFEGEPSDPAHSPDHFREIFLFQQGRALQLTNFRYFDTRLPLLSRGRVFFQSSADPLGSNAGHICQLFSVDPLGGHLRQLTHFEDDNRPMAGCFYLPPSGVPGSTCTLSSPIRIDPVRGTVLFLANCDPLGTNPYGDQVFAMRPDGSGLRQLTALRGMRTLQDGTVHVELAGPARGQ